MLNGQYFGVLSWKCELMSCTQATYLAYLFMQTIRNMIYVMTPLCLLLLPGKGDFKSCLIHNRLFPTFFLW
jgi:hypothetical protein